MMRIRLFSAVMGWTTSWDLIVRRGRGQQKEQSTCVPLFSFNQKPRASRLLAARRRQRNGNRCHEGRGNFVVPRLEVAAMRFDNRAGAMKPEAVMALPAGTKGLGAPTLGPGVKILF